jgi:hypothetical protein
MLKPVLPIGSAIMGLVLASAAAAQVGALYEAKPGGAVGCRDKAAVELLMHVPFWQSDEATERRKRAVMELGHCFPIMPGRAWRLTSAELSVGSIRLEDTAGIELYVNLMQMQPLAGR